MYSFFFCIFTPQDKKKPLGDQTEGRFIRLLKRKGAVRFSEIELETPFQRV